MRLLFFEVGVLCAILIGCHFVRSRGYVLESPNPAPVIAGWSIEPDIFAYKDIVGADTRIHSYTFSIWIRHKRSKESVIGESIPFVTVDSISVKGRQTSFSTTTRMTGAYWVSNTSHPEITRSFDFGPFLQIPLEDKAITLLLFARTGRGKHLFTTHHRGVQTDSVAIKDSTMALDTVRLSMELVLKDSKLLLPVPAGE